MVSAIVYRTELIEDPAHIAKVDAALAERSPQWTKYSRKKIEEYIDSWIGRFDPEGVREPRKPSDNRYLDIHASSEGMAGIWGNLHVQDAIVFDDRLDQLAATVCANDPRTKAQLRADAVIALAERQQRMACTCGADDCKGEPPAPARDVVIHVLAESSTVNGDHAAPGYVTGFGPIAADSVRELKKGARIKPVVIPADVPAERGYRPSRALAEFVRLRDLFCRFPGCECPAARCDVDHTIPYGQNGGLTHPSNLKCECRSQRASRTLNQPCYERIVEVLISDGETHGAYFERSNGGGTPVRRGLQRGRRRGHGRNMRRPDADPRRDVAACVAGTNS